ncbi:hypothetical protein [Dietzia psychralcaliphila]|uniref:hypothetical protein n=1 Tax=Dietzia psychralcaliphila TaxID=139021 RepID=UPI001C1E728D|nr:hypothetical protein [Dietzia psychralcaliphila]
MTRPTSVSIASWIWLFCGLLTTVTIVSILTATDVLALLVGMGVDDAGRGAVRVIGWSGWMLAVGLFAAMVVQVVAAVKLREGARWSRALLTFAASFSLMAVLYGPTLWSAWVLLIATAVALVLTYDDNALDYLEARPQPLASV